MSVSYLCYAMHTIPNSNLLSQIPYHKLQNYQLRWLNTNGKPNTKKGLSLCENSTALAVLNGHIALIPMDKFLLSQDVPYALAYDFIHPPGDYGTISQIRGFHILTLPHHDFQRSKATPDLALQLLYVDRAILFLAERREITPEIDKSYVRFLKLRNLFIDQSDTPEGLLAQARAITVAHKCYHLLRSVEGE